MTNLTKEDLIAFEADIAETYNQGLIKAPIHLRGGNEQQLINIFTNLKIKNNDWICCQWASHLECLLKGVPPSEIKKAILNQKSITLCFPEYKVISSAIVGSICPIATGIAMAEKIKCSDNKVYCFIGDMTFFNGAAQESIRYAQNHKLPLIFIVGDNGLSVKTPTKDGNVWNLDDGELEDICREYSNIIYYSYKNSWPHSGTGKFINLW